MDTQIQATDLSRLALKYRHSTNSRERDKLFMKIAEYYKPKILSQLKMIQHHDHSEFIQIYHMEIVKALNQWNLQSNFSTYLFLFIKGIYKKYMETIKQFPMIKEVDEDGNVTYRSVECITMKEYQYYEGDYDGSDTMFD